MLCQVQIVINEISAERARAVRSALEPDNVNIPEGLSIKMEDAGDKLIFNFESAGDMGHLIGTVDEMLGHIGVALKVIQ